MQFSELNISIKDYMGRMGPGVVVLLSMIHNEKVYEGMLWYTNKDYVLEIPEDLKKEIGEIKEHKDYEAIIGFLKSEVGEYTEIVEKMNEII
jgi:hypothetical protein